MSLLNLSINLTCYADESKNANPRVKFTDLTWSMLGLPTNIPKEIPVSLAGGESVTIASTQRTISYTGLTSFQFVQVPNSSLMQMIAPIGARTARPDGDGTTEWTVTISNQLVRFTYTGTGTAPTFGSMAAGDGITIGTGFSVSNQGDFTIVKVGANYVEFMNAFGVAETIVAQVEIYSSGPVQAGDTLDITSSLFAFPNKGQFTITRVTDQLIEFSNDKGVPEVVTGVSSGLVIYQKEYKWMLMALTNKAVVKLNGDTGSGTEVEPPKANDIENNPGLFLKRGKVFRVDIENPGIDPIEGVLFLAE